MSSVSSSSSKPFGFDCEEVLGSVDRRGSIYAVTRLRMPSTAQSSKRPPHYTIRMRRANCLIDRCPDTGSVAAVAEWYRYRIVACLVTSSSPVPLKIRRVGQRCTLNLSRAETSSRWCGVVVRRGVAAQVSSTSLDHGSKLRGPSPKALVQLNSDVNIQSINQTQAAPSQRFPVSSRTIAKCLAEEHLVSRRSLHMLLMTSTRRRLRLE
ncbi:uncharacterized protein TNCV_1160971 [Trichonephila clavipes]|nr:uncharacterized protein TNCV_1160971 [Trichonephila clavipes]